jgi:energy-coupling factor transporter ATP-binding protein EcfA2
MKQRVEDAMKLTGISELADRSPYSLSGGQQQRVALSSILVMQPKVLVLDEPTSQMDPIGTREVFGVVRTMAEQGMTVIMVEHKVENAAGRNELVLRQHHGEWSRRISELHDVPFQNAPAAHLRVLESDQEDTAS